MVAADLQLHFQFVCALDQGPDAKQVSVCQRRASFLTMCWMAATVQSSHMAQLAVARATAYLAQHADTPELQSLVPRAARQVFDHMASHCIVEELIVSAFSLMSSVLSCATFLT